MMDMLCVCPVVETELAAVGVRRRGKIKFGWDQVREDVRGGHILSSTSSKVDTTSSKLSCQKAFNLILFSHKNSPLDSARTLNLHAVFEKSTF